MHYYGTSSCSCNARFIKQTCAVRRDTERLMIGQSLSLIYAEEHTHTLSRFNWVELRCSGTQTQLGMERGTEAVRHTALSPVHIGEI